MSEDACKVSDAALLESYLANDHSGHDPAELINTINQVINPDSENLREYRVAKIDEERCIGCIKCIRACPFDAILGAAKQMHTIINDYCTGCQLCVTPCPVDCIDMVTPPAAQAHWYSDFSEPNNQIRQQAKLRLKTRTARLAQQANSKRLARERKQAEKNKQIELQKKQDFIKAAMQRSKAKKQSK